MTNEWQFWQDQLVGKEPETTPGTPHAGYFLNRNRRTYRNPKPGVGEPRHKVSTTYEPVAIWKDGTGWNCLIHGIYEARHITEVEKIDEVFSYVCRKAIPYEEYKERAAEMEMNYELV